MTRMEQIRALFEEVPTRYLFVEAAMIRFEMSLPAALTYYQNLLHDQRASDLAKGIVRPPQPQSKEEDAARARHFAAGKNYTPRMGIFVA